MTGLARKAESCIQRLADQLASSDTSVDGAATTTLGTGAVAEDAAAGGVDARLGRVPPDTVHKPSQGGASTVVATVDRALVVTPAAAMVAGGAEDAYGVADGSSPSCSQSIGMLPRWRPWGKRDVAGDAGPVGGGCNSGGQQPEPTREYADLGSGHMPRQRRRYNPPQPHHQEKLQVDGCGGGGDGGGDDGGGGATFLRNLARLSDNNSAASLSGPYVLEQLVELQQYVVSMAIVRQHNWGGVAVCWASSWHGAANIGQTAHIVIRKSVK